MAAKADGLEFARLDPAPHSPGADLAAGRDVVDREEGLSVGGISHRDLSTLTVPVNPMRRDRRLGSDP